MKKVLLSALGVLVLGVTAPAYAAPLVAVTDPVGAFSGTYNADDPATPEDEGTASQQGYVGVYEDGVVACNGNQDVTRPDDGSALQGYIWVGPGEAASNPTQQSPGGEVGAGDNNKDAAGNPTGDSPCPDADPAGVNE